MGASARIMLAALFVGGVASNATAQTTAYAPGQGSPNSVQLTIPVTASVAAACGFSLAPSGSHHENNFDDHAWSHDFSLMLDCSIPARLAVVSANGALKTSGTAPTGYATTAPYDVTLFVVQNSGNAGATCPVSTLSTGGGCTFIGPATPTQGLLVGVSQNQPGSYLRVGAPAYTGTDVLVASNGYTDILTVTLTPAL